MRKVATLALSSTNNILEIINSILIHVDYLHIYLQNFVEIPEFLNNSKIIIARSQDYGDFGEYNKYFWCDKLSNCYHFICIPKIHSIDDFKLKNGYDTNKIKTNIYEIINNKSKELLFHKY